MPFSTFYLPSSFCSHFLLSSILLFFSSQLSHWISKSRCHQTKISHSCRDWQIIALRLLCPFSPHLFNFSSFFSTFFSPLLFLCLPFSPHFHFSSFFSTPLPFSLPSFLFLLFFYLLSSHPPFLLEESPNNFNFPDLCFTSFSIGRLASFVLKSALSVSPFLLNVASWKLLKQGMFCCHKV